MLLEDRPGQIIMYRAILYIYIRVFDETGIRVLFQKKWIFFSVIIRVEAVIIEIFFW